MSLASENGAVLLTGGAGYIGSHTARLLSARGVTSVVFDNLSHGHRAMARWGPFVLGDVRDESALRQVMTRFRVTAVVHFAGLKSVGLSAEQPEAFHDHNVTGTAILLGAMRACGVHRLVFSSSAAVYGEPVPSFAGGCLSEGAPKAPCSPYGHTKLAAEQLIAARCETDDLSAMALRYFNAAGADHDGLMGEIEPRETHLIPLAIDAALGRSGPLTVFGDDYDTPDGSCLRDYVHVDDLARAHVAALEALEHRRGFQAINIGAGKGHSVFEVLDAVSLAVGHPAPWVKGDRRPGDPASLVADITLARQVLGWTPEHSGLSHIVETAVLWRRGDRFRGLMEERDGAAG